jgi:DNA-binding NtrC family response regulator
MARVKILLADNDADFCETRREFLKRASFDVIPVASPEEARKKLVDENPDVAILDIRLLNDDDEKDISGLELAREIGRLVPVLLFTGYPSLEYARQALKSQLDGLPAAYDFILKQDGPEGMLIAIRNALRVAETRQRVIAQSAQETEKTTWQQWRPVVAMIALLLALGAGVSAMVFGEPSWLFGTVAFAILSVVLIGLANMQAE